ncbi:Sb-PDE family phosphodiesterase [uncultured Sunxiuqinia sp.]|uniref:Sb-PDE family phosphodiesterase n=1 Tax=Sunxiuqinia rutila TaxID=1397841 RepID=UPI002621123E|nr:Sb-PDE family phosphodiesterase [uncultured Sunxiuqinia sp.]
MNNLKLLFLLFAFPLCALAQSRTEVNLPDIPGYLTLKCDFHMHTVFSDGAVWPTVRVQEAWAEGLDAIAITDHIEYLPHSQDMEIDHNRSFEIAEPLAEQMGIVLIPATEITRKMPPGHLNALFITNANLMDREDWWEACVEAKEQGAFILWNHPGWKAQQPDTTRWWDEHTRLLNSGMLHGMEVYNHKEFYPEVLGWARDKKLTVFANSDVHAPIHMTYGDKHRPMTLVFATDKSMGAIKQALKDRRTVAYFDNQLVGERQYLTPLFFGSVKIKNKRAGLENHQIRKIQIHNSSDLDFHLKLRQPAVGFSCPESITLKAHQTVFVDLTGTSDEVATMDRLKLSYEVSNLLTLDGKPLSVNLDIANR